MADPFLGEIRMAGFNFAPAGWALCQGQTLAISTNQALFALLGVQFGGNGTTNFQLPDLQGRVPLGQGNGIGLPPYLIGQKGGAQSVTLTLQNLPAHTHLATFAGSGGGSAPVTVTVQGSSAAGGVSSPTGNYLAGAGKAQNTDNFVSNPGSGTLGNIAGVSGGSVTLPAPSGTVTVQPTGTGLPLTIEPPYLCVNFIIALQGIFPSRG
jgi:microcystin-dependent protein